MRSTAFTLVELPVVSKGFTLVELLVVVAIIAVLMSLLAPAMDQAIYQAELAACGAGLRAGATGLVSYAMNHRGRYPERGTLSQVPVVFYASFTKQAQLRPYMSVNGALNDPLLPSADYDNDPGAAGLYPPRAVWYGWRYDGQKGMFKLGDRWTWADTGSSPHSFSILLSDLDFINQGFSCWGSHPDRDEVLHAEVYRRQTMPNEFAPGVSFNVFVMSRWFNPTVPYRGPIDMNFAADDGAVNRITEIPYAATLVGYNADRVRGVPWNYNGQYGESARTLVPSSD